MNDTLVDDQQVFHKQVAFNVIPQVGDFQGDETVVEWAFNAETKQILGPDVRVHANCAIIPAFIGCGQYVNVECAEDIDVEDARELMKNFPVSWSLISMLTGDTSRSTTFRVKMTFISAACVRIPRLKTASVFGVWPTICGQGWPKCACGCQIAD